MAADIDQELNVSLAASWAATLLPGATVADPFLSGVDKEVASGLLVYVMILPLLSVPTGQYPVPAPCWVPAAGLQCPRLRLAAKMSVQVLKCFAGPSTFIWDLLSALRLGSIVGLCPLAL